LTSEIYGNPTVHPQNENYWGNVNPIGPRACYNESKRFAETLFFDYHRQNKTNIKVARIFNTYGPRTHPSDGRVVSNFIVQALQNKPIEIHGDGTQTRSFCYVDDLVDGLIRLMATTDAVLGPVNLGNPNELPISELAEQVIAITESTSKVTYQQRPENDPQRRRPDISLARNILKWEPQISLQRGLGLTVEYFRTLLAES